MITKKKLYWRTNETDYSVHLQTTKTRYAYNFAVYVDEQILYVPMYTARNESEKQNKIGCRIANDDYYVADVLPTVTISSNLTNDPATYQDPIVVNFVEMSLTVAINNSIELQYRDYNNNWVTFVTLPAGATYVDGGGGYRIPSQSWRVKVGSWTSSFTQNTGNDRTNRTIPEAYWGV